jgi:hypothetical protein
MADGTDLPATGGGTTEASSESVTTEPALGPAPAAEPPPYRPLSLLAVVAFGAAAIFAAVVGFGGLFAMINRTPWLLPMWMVVLPILAVGTAFLARFQIRQSENTQTGGRLATWAIGLSVGIGLVYGMYFLGTFFAVRWKAQAFAERWLKKIAEGKTEAAFLDSIKQPHTIIRSPDDADERVALRRTVELMHNNPPPEPSQGGGRGPYSGFTSGEYVRLIQLAGKDAKFEPTGVREWDYEEGGYMVVLGYRVTTDLATFPLQVTIHGSGTDWRVVFVSKDGTKYTGLSDGRTTPDYNPEAGHELMRLHQMAAPLANLWVNDLANGQFDRVHAATLDRAEREDLLKLHARTLLPRLAVGAFPPLNDAEKAFFEGRQMVFSGGLVRKKDGVFWAPDELRDTVVNEVKAVFDPGKFTFRQLRLQPGSLPSVERDDKRIHLGYDIQMTLPHDPKEPPLLVEGRVIVGADLAAVTGTKVDPDAWRVEALELVRGRNSPTPPPQARPRQGPGR